MKKREIISEVQYILKKHDFANHPAIIEAAINNVYNQMMGEMSPAALRDFEFYTKNYEVAVSQDTGASERYYSTLPVSIVTLQKPQQGVISINSKAGTGFRLYPTTEKNVRMTEGIEAGLYNRYWGWYLNRDTVWYVNFNDELADAGVRMSLAVQFMDFASTDEVPLPAGRDYEIVQLVVDFIRQTNIIDLQVQK